MRRTNATSLFTGLELIPPGLVTTTGWGTAEPAPTGQTLFLAGVGEVPGSEAFEAERFRASGRT